MLLILQYLLSSVQHASPFPNGRACRGCLTIGLPRSVGTSRIDDLIENCDLRRACQSLPHQAFTQQLKVWGVGHYNVLNFSSNQTHAPPITARAARIIDPMATSFAGFSSSTFIRLRNPSPCTHPLADRLSILANRMLLATV